MHYTFDFAQHFQLPHHARQMGPTYFLQLRRVQLFGVRVDSTSMQLNFLIDEDQTIGKDGSLTNGPNAVISMLDHVNEYGFGEEACSLHADNCTGQNKNQFVLAYLCWRVLLGLHDAITLMMQIPGHTSCLVDSGFAHIRKPFRRSDVDSFDQLLNVVQKSSTSNTAIPYLQNETSSPTWEWRDWKEFLARNFKPLKGIWKYHHFRFSNQDPGFVFLKENGDCAETKVSILKHPITHVQDRQRIITPPGLSKERQAYLYQNVRPYVRPVNQDNLCPRPSEE